MVTISENPSYSLSKHTSPAASSSSHQPHHTYSSAAVHVSPRASLLCEILTTSPIEDLEHSLSSSAIEPPEDVVAEVLRLSYESPTAAIRFFRWAGLGRPHPAHNWDLMVDLLGSNGLFEEMWDAIRSMRDSSVLSKNTFFIIFRNYCGAGRAGEAVMAFDVMEEFGVQQDVEGVNASMREIGMKEAFGFFDRVRERIASDIDTYAILMEGLEKDGNVAKAKVLLREMEGDFRWNEGNVRVYDAYLINLFKGLLIYEAIEFIHVMKKEGCVPGFRFFSEAINVLHKKNDLSHASSLWEIMVNNGILPDVGMFNSLIGLFCSNNKIDSAFRFLDEMVVYGAFPDSVTYNTIFKCLVKNKKVREAGIFFTEMTKNEFPPTHLNCAAAIALFFDGDDPEMAVEIWYYMVNNRVFPFEESANMLLIGLCKMGRLTELKRFAEKMLERNIHISEATMGKIKQAFHKRGGDACDAYDSLSRKWTLAQ